MNFETKVRECIRKYEMLAQGDGVLVGVSGGPDSMALFHILCKLRWEYGWRLAVAHMIHGIRGEEAKQDAIFVAQMAEKMGVPFYLKEVDLPQMRVEGDEGNLEALGRKVRYEFFTSMAEQFGLNKVATAHTRDDQAETLLMWLLRGSGRRGLGGMPPLRKLVSGNAGTAGPLLVRPLIEVSKKEIMAYLSESALEYRIDQTNLDCRPLRNWIRHCLLSQLQEKIDEKLTERLAHLADIFREEEKILTEMVWLRLERLSSSGNLMRREFLQDGKAMQRRVVRTWLETQSGRLSGMGFNDVERVLKFIVTGPAQGRLSFPGGWELVREYDTLCLEKKNGEKTAPVSYSYSFPRGGEVMIPEAGVQMLSSGFSCSSFVARPGSELEAVFDSSSLPETLTVRNFRPGDRFQPLGMQGHKKVKDLFIEKKVPLPVRRTLPILLAGEKILWIPSYGRSEIAKTGPQTREILKVHLTVLDSST